MSEISIALSDDFEQLADIGLENFPPYLMNRIMGRYNAAVHEEMANLGLTTPQLRSLAVLSTRDGILIRELAVYTVVPQSTLSRALEPLDRDGLIRRETDETDSRATRVFITNAGHNAYKKLWPHLARSYEAMFVGIDDDKKRMFLSILQQMLQNIRKHDF